MNCKQLATWTIAGKMASLKLLFLSVLALVSTAYGGKLWPQGAVHYRYDSSVAPNSKLREAMKEAMGIWENATCINFEQSADEDSVVFYSHPNEEYCKSSIGYRTGGQNMTLGYACQAKGDLLSILGHSMGLHVEQTRPDRNEYVSVVIDNIEEGEEENFAIHSDLVTGYQGVAYDFISVMHLSASAYSKRGQVTTQALPQYGDHVMGGRQDLSPGDVLKASRLYNCPGTGVCEVLNVNVGSIRDLGAQVAGEYHVEVVGVDGEGRTQNLSSTPTSPGDNSNLTWNETLSFQVNTAKWQFFRIMVKQSPDNNLLFMVETVTIEVGGPAVRRQVVIESGTAELSFSYECTADGDDCDPDPCISATRCNDGLFQYTCDCLEGFGGKNCNIQCPNGYSGHNCTIDVSGDSCWSNPCIEGHSTGCADGFFDYTCNCLSGYGGKRCQITCPRGYSGRNCDVDISGDSCSSSPCHAHNSFDCVDLVYDYNCTCVVGFGGKNCERSCEYGYGGYNCDTDLSGDSCGPNPCHSAGSVSCTDGFFDYTCNCRTGYGGKQCERECHRGYDGYNCNIDISGNSCDPNPCHSRNSRRCTDGFFDYTCTCRAGYGGKTCSTNLCAGSRCRNNGGSCLPYRYSPNYRCQCPLAWTPASHCSQWEERCLQVVIESAWGLSDRDGFLKGKSDPYTVIRAYASNGYSTSDRTRYIQGDHSPTWNHRFNAGCGRSWDRFYFRLYDSDWGSDDTLSSGQYVNLKSLSRFPKCNHDVSVVGGGGTIRFDIYYYTQNGPGQPGSC
jgi:hypothetical protein